MAEGVFFNIGNIMQILLKRVLIFATLCGRRVKHFYNKIWYKRMIFILTNGGCMWHNMGTSRVDKKYGLCHK